MPRGNENKTLIEGRLKVVIFAFQGSLHVLKLVWIGKQVNELPQTDGYAERPASKHDLYLNLIMHQAFEFFPSHRIPLASLLVS